MATTENANRYEMTPEDTQRMARLSEEVRSRLLEMALITARTAGLDLGANAVIKFVPHRRRSDDPKVKAEDDWMELIEVDGVEACYGVIGGQAFAESPCGG